jgi:hypothetical protein
MHRWHVDGQLVTTGATPHLVHAMENVQFEGPRGLGSLGIIEEKMTC